MNLLFLFLPVGAFPLSIIEYISGARSYFFHFFWGFLPIGSMVLVYIYMLTSRGFLLMGSMAHQTNRSTVSIGSPEMGIMGIYPSSEDSHDSAATKCLGFQGFQLVLSVPTELLNLLLLAAGFFGSSLSLRLCFVREPKPKCRVPTWPGHASAVSGR